MALITLNKLALPTASVLQVVSSGESTLATINSTAYVTAVSLSITPTSASNKIFVTFDGQYQQDDVNNAKTSTKLTRTVGGTETTIFDDETGRDITEGNNFCSPNFAKLDEPNTTSEVTYKIYGKSSDSNSDWRRRTHTMLNAFEIKG